MLKNLPNKRINNKVHTRRRETYGQNSMMFELLENLRVLAYLSLGGGGIRVANKLFIAHPANIT